MPNDLERAFAALSDDTARSARLAPAADVRKRGDRQTLTRSVAGVAAAVVLVAGVAVGSRLALTDKALPPVPPAQSVAPTSAPPSTGASATPSAPAPSAPSGSAGRPGSVPSSAGSSSGPAAGVTEEPAFPAVIPNKAFLTTAETGWGRLSKPGRTSTPNPPFQLCADAPGYPSEDQVAVGQAVQILYGAPEVNPDWDFQVIESITIYRGDGAERALDEFRAAVQACPSSGGGRTNKSRGAMNNGLGDESLLLQTFVPADDKGTGEYPMAGVDHHTYTAVIRIGNMVVSVYYAGKNGQEVPQTHTEQIVRAAVKNAKAWRN